MSNKNLRNVIRSIHLIAAATLGIYFYSPIAGDETLRLIIQFVTLPSIVLTGIALWQQAYLNKLLNRNTRKSAASSARSIPTDQYNVNSPPNSLQKNQRFTNKESIILPDIFYLSQICTADKYGLLVAQRCALPAGGRDETAPFCRNQLQVTQPA